MYTTRIAFLTMKVKKDFGRHLISATFYQYVSSAIPTCIEMALLTDNYIAWGAIYHPNIASTYIGLGWVYIHSLS
jgi:hypothetical protein